PPCAPLFTAAVWPLEVQPERDPVSNPPLTTPPPVVPPGMVQLTTAVCELVPLVPVTVTLYVPAAALPAPSESVELPPAPALAGLRLAAAPEGAPLALSATTPENPFTPVMEMVLAAVAPLTEAGLAASEKSGV